MGRTARAGRSGDSLLILAPYETAFLTAFAQKTGNALLLDSELQKSVSKLRDGDVGATITNTSARPMAKFVNEVSKGLKKRYTNVWKTTEPRYFTKKGAHSDVIDKYVAQSFIGARS